MKALNIIALTLVIVGALNWGLIAVANFDLVATIVGLKFGETNAVSRIIYGLVGIAALYSFGFYSLFGRNSDSTRQMSHA